MSLESRGNKPCMTLSVLISDLVGAEVHGRSPRQGLKNDKPLQLMLMTHDTHDSEAFKARIAMVSWESEKSEGGAMHHIFLCGPLRRIQQPPAAELANLSTKS